MKTAKWIAYVLGVSSTLLISAAFVFFSESSSVMDSFTNTMWPVLPVEIQVLLVFFCLVVPTILFIEALT